MSSRAFAAFHAKPSAAAVYNLGGGREQTCSMLEAIALCEAHRRARARLLDLTHAPRVGDHRWWVSSLESFRSDYPEWELTFGIEQILRDIHAQNVEQWTGSRA